jgi:hypothetical protein
MWLSVLAGCGGKGLSTDGGGTGGKGGGNADGGGTGGTVVGRFLVTCPPGSGVCTEQGAFSTSTSRDVDILFMVDNSLGMEPLQAKLTQSFATFTQTLEALPAGLPNLHLAVVTSDMGAGPETAIPQCRPGGDQGLFQAVPRGACTATGLFAGQTYISSSNGQTNFDATKQIPDIFNCIALFGGSGCGVEHQLESVVRALGADGDSAPAQNANFLRTNAFLAIVLFTNEDDCSAPPNTNLFNTSSILVSDPLGPLQSYRCNEFGHLCRGAPPPRTMAASFAPGECMPAEDKGLLIPVGTFVQEIKALKADPSKILVAALAGPPDPYNVVMVPPVLKQDPSMWPNVDHSCTIGSGEVGDPSIRIKAFVDGFGGYGVFLPICAATFAPALQRIAEEIGKLIGQQSCVPGPLADKDAVSSNGVQPDCTVVAHTLTAQGQVVNTPVPACADQPTAPLCWTTSSDAIACPEGAVFQLRTADPTAPLPNYESVTCAVCSAGGQPDPRCP